VGTTHAVSFGCEQVEPEEAVPVTWFKVDDSFHAHPKVLATPPGALGLWVVAGAWSSANLTEGFVPDRALPRLLPGSAELADDLVTAGLWRKVRGGYRFHDWTDYNPTRQEALAAKEKMASGGAIGNHRRWHVAKGVIDPACAYCQHKQDRLPDRPPDRVPEGVGESGATPPTRPDPTRKEGEALSASNGRVRASPEPPLTCPKHANDPDPPPCGPCANARRTHDRWEADRNTRYRYAPKCRKHQGKLAHNCPLCRSERIAQEAS
jgi:hypothetical protein